MYIVKNEQIHASAFIIPEYRNGDGKSAVTMEYLGEAEIGVPSGMLKEHVACTHFRARPIENDV